MHSASQHAELMRKVENLNLLSDKERDLLREERDRLQKSLTELETKTKVCNVPLKNQLTRFNHFSYVCSQIWLPVCLFK